MSITAAEIEQFLNEKIRPKVRVDGGEIVFSKLEGSTIYLIARNECSTCPATTDGLKWWITREMKKKFNADFSLSITKEVPYFT